MNLISPIRRGPFLNSRVRSMVPARKAASTFWRVDGWPIWALHAWTRASGRRLAHELAGAIEAALDQPAFALDGHRLIALRHEFTDVRREADGETWRALVRFRAVTEPV